MSDFHSVPVDRFSSLFERIGKQWMLITAADGEQVNAMTASWGTFGILWGKPVAICFIRPQRHTFSLTERADRLSLTFFDPEYHGALSYMGTHSGRDGDKFEATGLHVRYSDGVPYASEASVAVICRKLYATRMQEQDFIDADIVSDHYPNKDFHQVYVCEIEQVLIRNQND